MNVIGIEEQVLQLGAGRPHVVLLGAGASLAAVPDGDRRGVRPPLMGNFISTLGLEPLLREHGVQRFPDDFERLYGMLHGRPRYGPLLTELERRVHEFFGGLALPDDPTLYDHLVLSLRGKDTIATFNWDPLLLQAYERNRAYSEDLPRLLFLHGCVAVGYCAQHPGAAGRPGTRCPCCHQALARTPLMYPVAGKDYLSNPFIARQWGAARQALREAALLTVLGYSAPSSDAEAVRLLRSAWAGEGPRELVRVEIIDVKPEEEVARRWRSFFLSEQRGVCPSFYESWLGRHPRRSCEAAVGRPLRDRRRERGLPAGGEFDELYEWLEPLVAAERAWAEVPLRAG